MMRKYTHLYILASLILITSCKKFELIRVTKISTQSFTFINNTVKAKGTIIDIADKGIQSYGFCWALHENPSINDNQYSIEESAKIGDYTVNIPSLLPDKEYYGRSFAIAGNEIIYGEILDFNTNQSNLTTKIKPVQIINSNKIKVNGSIEGVGDLIISSYGHCYSRTPNPTINDNKTSFVNLNKDTSFTSEINGLWLNTIYYIRTYAVLSSNKVIYSNNETVNIPALEIETDTFSVIDANTVNLKGTFINLGADSILEYGFVWSATSSFPTYNDNKIIHTEAPKVGSFFRNLNNLNAGTRYFYRAFASNGSIIFYGASKSFLK